MNLKNKLSDEEIESICWGICGVLGQLDEDWVYENYEKGKFKIKRSRPDYYGPYGLTVSYRDKEVFSVLEIDEKLTTLKRKEDYLMRGMDEKEYGEKKRWGLLEPIYGEVSCCKREVFRENKDKEWLKELIKLYKRNKEGIDKWWIGMEEE